MRIIRSVIGSAIVYSILNYTIYKKRCIIFFSVLYIGYKLL